MLSEGSFVNAAKGTSWMHETLVRKMEDESRRRIARRRGLLALALANVSIAYIFQYLHESKFFAALPDPVSAVPECTAIDVVRPSVRLSIVRSCIRCS